MDGVGGQHVKPLPPFAGIDGPLKAALASLRPARRMSVTDCAEKYMMVNANGRWVAFDRTTAPYMVEPADMIASRNWRELVFVGPARASKTLGLLQVGLAYAIMVDPSKVYVTHMGQTKAKEWVEGEVAPMIRNSPALAERQGRGIGDKNIFSKRFVGGTHFGVGWPTAENFSARRAANASADNSRANSSSIPGRRTLTATWREFSARRAECTWAMDAAATASPKKEKI